MKDKLIKIKLVRDRKMLVGDQFQLKSIVGAISLPSYVCSEIRYYPGDYVSEKSAQAWVDAFQTYEVTISDE
jgi:hypothetical protein